MPNVSKWEVVGDSRLHYRVHHEIDAEGNGLVTFESVGEEPRGFVAVVQRILASEFRGKLAVLAAGVTRDSESCHTVLSIKAELNGQCIASSQVSGTAASFQVTEVLETDLFVPEASELLVVGLSLTGPGRARFNSVSMDPHEVSTRIEEPTFGVPISSGRIQATH